MRNSKLVFMTGLFVFISTCVGCEKTGKLEMTQLVSDHKKLVTETNTSVIASIKDELKDLKDSGMLSAEDETKCQILIDRLNLSIKQSDVMERYMYTNEVDQNLLSEMIKNKWKEN